jgi:hypothetical protein
LRVISKLGDNPGTDNGMTTQEFREAFDQAPLLIQQYINEVLIPAANASSSPEEGLNMQGPINMNNQALKGLNAPTEDDEAVNWGSVKNAAGVGIPLPLGIPYGGMGATDPKTARENLEITPENIGAEPVGAVRMELLWENASPDSDFAGQTIKIDMSGYGGFIIQTAENSVFVTNKIGQARKDEVALTGAARSGVDGSPTLGYRAFKCVAEGISITNFFTANWSTINNQGNRPQYIYGIKGVSA